MMNIICFSSFNLPHNDKSIRKFPIFPKRTQTQNKSKILSKLIFNSKKAIFFLEDPLFFTTGSKMSEIANDMNYLQNAKNI